MTYETKQKPGVRGDKIIFYKLYIKKGMYDKKFIPKTKINVWDREGKKEEKNKTNCEVIVSLT